MVESSIDDPETTDRLPADIFNSGGFDEITGMAMRDIQRREISSDISSYIAALMQNDNFRDSLQSAHNDFGQMTLIAFLALLQGRDPEGYADFSQRFQRDFGDDIDPGTRLSDIRSLDGQSFLTHPDYVDVVSRETLNMALRNFAETYAGNVEYDFGSKDISSGGIDCSGFVAEAFGFACPDNTFRGLSVTHSHGQVAHIFDQTGFVLDSSLIGREAFEASLRGGMIIGLDTGDRGWDRGRADGQDIRHNMDHVGFTFEREDGTLMFAHSSGSGQGVNIMTMENALDRYGSANFYAVDPAMMMELDSQPDIDPDNTPDPDDPEGRLLALVSLGR